MKEQTVFVADDGQRFDSAQDACRHELTNALMDCLDAVGAPNPRPVLSRELAAVIADKAAELMPLFAAVTGQAITGQAAPPEVRPAAKPEPARNEAGSASVSIPLGGAGMLDAEDVALLAAAEAGSKAKSAKRAAKKA